MEEKKKSEKWFKNEWFKNMTQLILVGCITGFFVGIVVTFFSVLMKIGEDISRGFYFYVRENPIMIFLLLIGLFCCAFVVSVAVRVSAIICGSGIPQAEGAMRGLIRFHWWKDAVAMAAASLVAIFSGLSIGTEGPSVLIGACIGDGVGSITHRNQLIKKYQITGGACTGLAVASNAPLTGIVFAFEEAHKRFTPEVFICAFSSVIIGMLVRSGIYFLLGMEIRSSFHSYVFNQLPFYDYGYVVMAGIICGLVGLIFRYVCLSFYKLLKKIRLKTPQRSVSARIFIAVFIGGFTSLLFISALGGGHDLIELLGTYGGEKEYQTIAPIGISVFWFLLFSLLAKLIVTGVNVGAGLPCGIFIPIIAIGACLGGLLNGIWVSMGLSTAYCDLMIMICMAAFFVTVVRAPLTAVIMICEFTGSFTFLLPVIIAVAIGYAIGEITHTVGIYEDLLEMYEEENGIQEKKTTVFTLTLQKGALAERREVQDILWPAKTRIMQIKRGEDVIIPDGGTQLKAYDELTVICETEEEQVKEEFLHILG